MDKIKKPMTNRVLKVQFAAFLLFFVFGCNKEESKESLPSTACKPKHIIEKQSTTTDTSESTASSPFKEGKVLIRETLTPEYSDSSSPHQTTEHQHVQAASSTDEQIPQGRRLVFAIDVNCASSAANGEGLSNSMGFDIRPVAENLIPLRFFTVTLDSPINLAEFEREVEADSCIQGVSELHTYQAQFTRDLKKQSSHSSSNSPRSILSTPNDPKFNEQNYLSNIRASLGWDIFYHSETGIKNDIVIAVIDNGVDIDHEDLQAAIWQNTGEVADNKEDDDNNEYTDDVYGWNFANESADPRPSSEGVCANGHGTHVASLAAAPFNNNLGIAGVMGNRAKIMPLNVFEEDDEEECTTTNVLIAEAMIYAVNKGAHIINMSLGGKSILPGYTDFILAHIISESINDGTVIVAAVGNDNEELTPLTVKEPASLGALFDGAIAVGAINATTNDKCIFSNHSSIYVEIAAPGCDGDQDDGLVGALPENKYGKKLGTSMSTPIVAGAAGLAYGLIRERTDSTPSPAKIEEFLKNAARTESELSSYFKNGKVLDIRSLAEAIDTSYPTTTTTTTLTSPSTTTPECE